ncbi:hypothetical protein VTL71DRAFT_8642 [Oculimacula yallundae]|uniref:Uncharacterized protein n=1 Tax=Oculimacula yallundae TaxID=86028 RepID=A0ABR4CYE8_9HELO
MRLALSPNPTLPQLFWSTDVSLPRLQEILAMTATQEPPSSRRAHLTADQLENLKFISQEIIRVVAKTQEAKADSKATQQTYKAHEKSADDIGQFAENARRTVEILEFRFKIAQDDYRDVLSMFEAAKQRIKDELILDTTSPPQDSDSNTDNDSAPSQEILELCLKVNQEKEKVDQLARTVRNEKADLEQAMRSAEKANDTKLNSLSKLEGCKKTLFGTEAVLKQLCHEQITIFSHSKLLQGTTTEVNTAGSTQQRETSPEEKDDIIATLLATIDGHQNEIETVGERKESELRFKHKNELDAMAKDTARATREQCRTETEPLVLLMIPILRRILEQQKAPEERNKAIIDAGNEAAHRGSAVAHALMYQSIFSVPMQPWSVEEFRMVYGFSPEFVWAYRGVGWFIQILNWFWNMREFHRHRSGEASKNQPVPFRSTQFHTNFRMLRDLILQNEVHAKVPIGVHLLADHADTVFDDMEKEHEASHENYQEWLKNRHSITPHKSG